MEDPESNKTEQSDPYIPDGAVTDPNLDRFRRWPFAQRIAQTIAARNDPSCIVVGVYGAWGEGKTTVLNFIQRELQNLPTIVPVKFNPWRFGDEASLLRSFFKTLADALNKSLSTKAEKLGKWLEQYTSLLSPISITLGSVVGVSPGEGVREFGKALSSVELETLKERIEKFLGDAKTRVVILMDDIDRLDKAEINNIFKLIKLTADFSYTAYVLSFDNRMVAAALRDRYAAVEADAGENFLDKIIQVPLHLPKADPIALRKLCFEGVEHSVHTAQISLSQDEVNEFVRHFIDGIEIRLQTPRSAKRYSNALLFALPLLKGEVNPIDLMLIEGVRVFYPKLYTFVRGNRDLFLSESADYSSHFGDQDNKREKRLLPAFEGLNADETEAAKSVLRDLFPRFSKMGYGSTWAEQWAKGKRIASEFYFDRYFSYTVPEGDVSDRAVEDLMSSLSGLSIEEITLSLNNIVTPRNADNLILKLRGRELDLSSESAQKLGVAISRSGSLFPNPEIFGSYTTAFSQAAILVERMCKNIPPGDERFSYAQRVIDEGTPLPFAIATWQWFRSDNEELEAERKLTVEQENLLSQRLAKRIKCIAQDGPTYLLHPRDSRSMLAIWENWISRAETNAYLAKSFTESKNNVLEFLKTYLGTGWGVESGLPSKSELKREEYNLIIRVVDPENVLQYLRFIYGGEIDRATLATCRFDASDKTTAFRFSAMHSIAIKEKEIERSQATNTSQADGSNGG